MDFRLSRRENDLLLKSGYVMNGLFLIFLLITAYYLGGNWPPGIWSLTLLLIGLTGFTYRESWKFDDRGTEYRFSLFFLTLKRDFYPGEETAEIRLNTFLRGRSGWESPEGVRPWYQTEQGLLKLMRRDGTEVILATGTNRKTGRLRDWGEEIALRLEVPFRINEKDPA